MPDDRARPEDTGRTVADLAHDLANAVGVILSYSELLRDQVADGAAADLARIRAAAERCTDVIRRLRDLAEELSGA